MIKITRDMLSSFRAQAAAHPNTDTLKAVLSKTDMADLAYLPQEAAKLEGPFSVEVKTSGITAQQKSGRCWCFAGLNILREEAAKRLGVEEFKLSANYLTFYDKLEKCNNFLGMVVEHAHEPLSSRMSQYLNGGIGDGGYWDMVVDLVKKYGVVPDYAMPETYQSEHTEKLMKLINNLLRRDMAILRRAVAAGEGTDALQEEMLGEIYRILCTAFGEPVETFDLVYRDSNKAYHAEYGITPQDFYQRYIGKCLDDYVTVVNEPTYLVPMGTPYTFHYKGSMAEGGVHCLNLPMEELRRMSIAQLEDGDPVWFGCDSGHYGDRQLGIWDPDSFHYEGLLGGASLAMSKQDLLETGEARATHAMILVGVNFDRDGRPNRWKIENSWGGDVGRKGYFVCSDRYFEDFVYECILNKKYFTPEELAMLEKTPIEIDPWLAY